VSDAVAAFFGRSVGVSTDFIANYRKNLSTPNIQASQSNALKNAMSATSGNAAKILTSSVSLLDVSVLV
jgi:hypothetical protein